ncbi:MAG: hypothetical protein HMLKMBBP_03317 [Planctomycetes bacterium]|nr:hypothetical protein [Planctomycetota bacterium]
MKRPPAAAILASAFLSGAAVMVVEMTAVRAMQPFFGSTNYVWTNVIAVVLAALAFGYWAGGRLSERFPGPRTYFGALALGACLVAAAVPLVTPVSSRLLPMEASLEGVVSPLVKASLAATIVLFAPAMIVLGTVSPLAIRLLSDSRGAGATGAGGESASGAGRAAGRVFACSTLGSLVGTYLPTLWLVEAFGSRTTLLVAAGMLLLPGALGLLLSGGGKGGALAAAAVAVTAPISAFADRLPGRAAPPLPDGTASVLVERETPYQYVSVREDSYRDGVHRMLTINEGVYTYHSFEVVGRVLTQSRYYDDYSCMPALVDLPDGATLRGAVVGLACGVTPRQWSHFWGDRYRLDVDGAEIDPAIIELGRKHFHLPPAGEPWLRSYPMDGRHMLAALGARGRRWHMIAIDAFANELYIPFHLGTVEFFELCRDTLEPGGIMAMNVYADRADAPNVAALENTVAAAFGHCVRVRQTWGGNFLLLARRGRPEDARNAAEPPDLRRLVPSRLEERFGKPAIAEWDGLLALCGRIPWAATIVRYDSAKPLLTDDHSPLESLTDEFLSRQESEILGR